MPRTDNEVRIVPSVLDRLLDDEPGKSTEPLASRSTNLRLLKQAVRRDLEWLLNTRFSADEIPPDLKEINHSLAVYGLPDLTGASIRSPADQTKLRTALKTAIAIFEPRLKDVTVTVEPVRDGQLVMRFRIDARLRVEPAPEPITFDTRLELGKGQYVIQED